MNGVEQMGIGKLIEYTGTVTVKKHHVIHNYYYNFINDVSTIKRKVLFEKKRIPKKVRFKCDADLMGWWYNEFEVEEFLVLNCDEDFKESMELTKYFNRPHTDFYVVVNSNNDRIEKALILKEHCEKI